MDGLDKFLQKMEDKDSEAFRMIQDYHNTEKDLDIKTDINKPYNIVVVDLICDHFEETGLLDCAEMLRTFIKRFKVLQISKKREGRKEFYDSLKAFTNSLDVSTDIIQNPMKKGL